jgi:hypothetical protein
MNNTSSSCPKKATAVRLGELKAPLQMEAMKQDRSLNWLIRLACKEYLIRKKKKERK